MLDRQNERLDVFVEGVNTRVDLRVSRHFFQPSLHQSFRSPATTSMLVLVDLDEKTRANKIIDFCICRDRIVMVNPTGFSNLLFTTESSFKGITWLNIAAHVKCRI